MDIKIDLSVKDQATTSNAAPIIDKGCVRVTYRLSKTGQRAALLAGVNAHAEQTISVAPTNEILAYASIRNNGEADLNVHGVSFGLGPPITACGSIGKFGDMRIPEFDEPQTIESLMARIEKLKLDASKKSELMIREAAERKQNSIRHHDWLTDPGPVELPCQTVEVGFYPKVFVRLPRGVYEFRDGEIRLIRLA